LEAGLTERGRLSAEKTEQEPIYVNLEEGIILDGKGGSRIFILGIGGWESIRQELDSTFLTGADVILQRMGYGYGTSIGKGIKRRGGQIEADPYPLLKSIVLRSGWGRCGLKSGDLSKGEARVAIKDCFFCATSSITGALACYFVAGALNGMIDQLTAFSHRVVEDKCRAKGDPFCEFVVERLEEGRMQR
jgi:predicted hydrocarbon binding protein